MGLVYFDFGPWSGRGGRACGRRWLFFALDSRSLGPLAVVDSPPFKSVIGTFYALPPLKQFGGDKRTFDGSIGNIKNTLNEDPFSSSSEELARKGRSKKSQKVHFMVAMETFQWKLEHLSMPGRFRESVLRTCKKEHLFDCGII